MKPDRFVRVEQHGSSLVVVPLFTFATTSEADIAGEWEQLQGRLAAADIKHVVIDLGSIPYFGSTVLEWMVQMWRRAKAKGGNLAVSNCSPIGREILSVAHFDKLWSIFPTRDEALAALASGK